MKHSIPLLLWMSLIGGSLAPAHAGEVLGRMSDDDAPAVTEPARPDADDRRIIYRVICSPEGEALPDCEKPFQDTESAAMPRPQSEVIEPAADQGVQPERKIVRSAKPKKSKNPAGKHKKAVKQAKKPASSKKKTAKKK